LDVVPAAVLVRLPAATLIAIDIAVAARVEIAARGARGKGVALRTATSDCRSTVDLCHSTGCPGSPVRHARRIGPLIASLHRGRAPAPVDTRALSCGAVRSRPRVVRFCGGARPVRPGCSPRGQDCESLTGFIARVHGVYPSSATERRPRV